MRARFLAFVGIGFVALMYFIILMVVASDLSTITRAIP